MTYTMVTLKADGGREERTLAKAPQIEDLQTAVGGYIQILPYFTKFEGHTRCTACANDEGLLKGLQVNTQATKAWLASYPASRNSISVVGDVVVYWKD